MPFSWLIVISLTSPRVGESGALISLSIDGVISLASVRPGTKRAKLVLRSQSTSNCCNTSRALARWPVVPAMVIDPVAGSVAVTTPGRIESITLRTSSALIKRMVRISLPNPVEFAAINSRALAEFWISNPPATGTIARLDWRNARSNRSSNDARETGRGVTKLTRPVTPRAIT